MWAWNSHGLQDAYDKGKIFLIPTRYTYTTKGFSAYTIAICLVKNRTDRNHFHTLVLSDTTNVTMITRWDRKKYAAHLGEEDVTWHGSKNIFVTALEMEAGMSNKQRLVYLHQPCKTIWLLQQTNKSFGYSNIWKYSLMYLKIQVKHKNKPLSLNPLRRSPR